VSDKKLRATISSRASSFLSKASKVSLDGIIAASKAMQKRRHKKISRMRNILKFLLRTEK